VEEDPVEPNLLFAGSELGLFVSLDRGRSWMKWTHGVPAVPIRGIVVHPRDHDLVIGTHGRAIWIVDDIRPLRALASDASIRERALHAFDAPPAQQHEVAMQGDAGILLGYRVVGHAMFFGESRPYGALLSYWVGPQAAGGRAQIQLRSADGRVVRELEGSAASGINRVVWDLREPAPTPAAGGGGGGGRGGQGPEVAPGTYQVTIRLGGQESTTTVQVLPDPRKEGVEFFITR